MNPDRYVTAAIPIKATSEEIIGAFLDPAWLRQWWGVARSMVQARRGGIWALAWDLSERGYQTTRTGVISRLGPYLLQIDSLVVFFASRKILGPLSLKLNCSPDHNTTRVEIKESGYQEGGDWDWFYSAVQKKWDDSLVALKHFLEHPHPPILLTEKFTESDHKVGISVAINAAPAEVLHGFFDAQALAHWWAVARCLIEPRPNGIWALAWRPSENGYQYITSGIIREFDFPRQVIIDSLVYFNPEFSILGPMRLGLRCDGDEKQSTLSVVQTGYGTGLDWERYYHAVADGWTDALTALKNYLEGKKP